jgi:hypothetical protein
MARTPLLIAPTLQEVLREAEKAGLPADEAEAFFYHYETNGWTFQRQRLKSWTNALALWRAKWKVKCNEASARRAGASGGSLSGADKVILGREYERILERMRLLHNRYAEGMLDWRPADKAEYKKLRERRDELKVKLGITI